MAVIPPGGQGMWHYKQPWNNRTLPFEAFDREQLEQKVRDFRAQNDLDPTTVTADLDAYYKGIRAPQAKRLGTLRERVTNWVANRKFQQNAFVEPDVAEARAALVSACPYNNTQWGDSCKDCTRSVFSDSFGVRAGRTTSQGEGLGACDIVGWDNRTAVHLTVKSLKTIVNVKNPPANACCMKWAIKDEKP